MKNILIPRNTFLFISCVYVCLYILKALYLQMTVYGDGIFYYSWLRSIVLDRNVIFINEYAYFGVQQLVTSLGLVGNQFAIGPGLLWSPAFLGVHSIVQGSGYEFIYQFAVGLLGCAYALCGLFLVYRSLIRWYSSTTSILTTVAIAFGTNIFFYGALDTVNSHAVSFFIASLLVFLLLEKRMNYVAVGLLAGMMGMIRIQDSMFIVFPFVPILVSMYTLWKKRSSIQTTVVKHVKPIFMVSVGFLLPIVLQFSFWYLVYGDIRIPYLERGYGFSFLQSSFLSVLFSPNNGLFFWTPLIGISWVGLFFIKKKILVPIGITTLLFFLWQTYLIGSWSIWWQGASFSGRMFISLVPFLAIGLATVLDVLEQRKVSERTRLFFVFAFSLLTMILMLYFLRVT